MNTIHEIDRQLQSQFPTLMVPILGAVPEMEKNGHRFLVANNGLWVQVKRAWLKAILAISPQPIIPVPYGAAQKQCEIIRIPRKIFLEFADYAKECYPLECAARILYDKDTDTLQLEKMIPTQSSNSLVAYKIRVLKDNEELVLDLHSHGAFDSFFSDTDDKDDANEVKVAGVIGFPNGINQSANWCFRLCINGMFEGLHLSREDDFITLKLRS